MGAKASRRAADPSVVSGHLTREVVAKRIIEMAQRGGQTSFAYVGYRVG